MKEFLSREGVSFTDRNVEEEHEAYTELVALGFRTVPITVIGRHFIKGFDERALRDALADVVGQ